MSNFDYTAEAELFPARNWKAKSRGIGYKRFTRASVEKRDDGKINVSLEIDVIFADTGADAGRMFREYFDLMKHQAAQFRKFIDFS